jgi:subtilisin family serine protease
MKARVMSFLIVLLMGVAQAFAAKQQVIVKLDRRVNIKDVSKFMRGRVLDQIPGQDLYLVEVPERLAVNARFLGVHHWEPNRFVRKLHSVQGIILSAPNLGPRWYDAQPALDRIGRPAAAPISTGTGVVIADINSQFDYAHPALAGAFTAGYDFILDRPYTVSQATVDQSDVAFLDQSDVAFLDQSDVAFLDAALSVAHVDAATSTFLTTSGVTAVSASTIGPQVNQSGYSHGTLCAGIIHSIAPGSMIMPLRAFDDSGSSDLFTVLKAVDFAVAHSAHVINMSFGMDTDSPTVHTSIQSALAAGITVVASSGNNNSELPQYPALYPGVISVAATDNSDLKSSFSNYGAYVTVSAPGVNLIASFPGGYYAAISGTSFSAPIVAAEAALLRAVLKDPATVIPQSSVNINALNPAYTGALGAGRVDLFQAVRP